MTLADGEITKEYEVTGMKLSEAVMRRLEALGIFEGTRIKVLGKKRRGAVIIKVRGARWAIGLEMAAGIDVEGYLDERDY